MFTYKVKKKMQGTERGNEGVRRGRDGPVERVQNRQGDKSALTGSALYVYLPHPFYR
jgi:hypothetical protein